MIYLVAIVFPCVSIACGVVTLLGLIKYVVDIRREFESRET